jgi:hypothetical protein
MSETELSIGPEAVQDSSGDPKVKNAPLKDCPLEFTYISSPDGIDENLLIMLHGLGEHVI